MTEQALTLISGVVLLLVFVLVGWYQRRRSESREPKAPRRAEPP